MALAIVVWKGRWPPVGGLAAGERGGDSPAPPTTAAAKLRRVPSGRTVCEIESSIVSRVAAQSRMKP